MPIGKVWIYVGYCLSLCCAFVCTVTDFFGEDKAATNFALAQWYMGVLGRVEIPFPILGNFASPEAQNRTNRPATGKYSLEFVSFYYY